MKRPRPSPHQACRSLLQKAVRRGDAALVSRVAGHLDAAGEGEWLAARAGVIAFEECWPVFGDLPPERWDAATLLATVTPAAKAKDAAGLGTLAHALSEGDRSVLADLAEDRPVRVIDSALVRPQEFWEWCRSTAAGSRAHGVAAAARAGFRRAAWPRDKAIALAAAYLAAAAGVPAVEASAAPPVPCPSWVALDRHTDVGREALRRVAKEVGVPYARLALLGFYLEGALANETRPSPWWDREVAWRLRQIGLGEERAREAWERARPRLVERLAAPARALEEHLAGG